MKIRLLEIIGVVFIAMGLSVSPDYGNTSINLLTMIGLVFLGAVCFFIDGKLVKGGKQNNY